MKSMSYSAARSNLAKAIEEVTQNHAPILITRQKGAAAVLGSLEDFESWQETVYLMRVPANAAHLRRGMAQVRARKTRRRKLLK